MTGHFRKKSIIFRDTTDNQEHDAKNRLLIPGPSSEKPVAEIAQLKKTDLSLLNESDSAIELVRFYGVQTEYVSIYRSILKMIYVLFESSLKWTVLSKSEQSAGNM